MAKYHVNDKGTTGVCRAANGHCPFGGEAQHYGTQAAAQKAFELSMASETLVAKRSFRQLLLSKDDARERNFHFLTAVEATVSKKLDGSDRNRLMMAAQVAHTRVDPKVDSYKATEQLKAAFDVFAKGGPGRLSEDELHSLKQASFRYISPIVGRASAAMENELASAGWDTRASGAEPLAFERTFAEATRQPGALTSPSSFAGAFRDVVKADKYWGYEDDPESDKVLLAGAKQVYKITQASKPALKRELKLLP